MSTKHLSNDGKQKPIGNIIKKDNVITIDKTLPIIKLIYYLIKREKLAHAFHPLVNINDCMIKKVRTYGSDAFIQIANYTHKCYINIFKMFDEPYNAFSIFLNSSNFEKYMNNLVIKKLKINYNTAITNLIGMDNYVQFVFDALIESNNYKIVKNMYETFYMKELSDDGLKEIIRRNRLAQNHLNMDSFIIKDYRFFIILDRKQFKKLSRQDKHRYNDAVYSIMTMKFFKILNDKILKRLDNITHRIKNNVNLLELKEYDGNYYRIIEE